MLERLLKLIQEGKPLTPVVLARQLNTSPQMVEMMMEELVRRGLLKMSEFSQSCDSGACNTCYLAKTCHASQQRIWMTPSKPK